MAKRDYYEVLGLNQTATEEEIRSRFKKLALQYHPDRNPQDRKGAEERFKEAAEAYQVLSDPEKRRIYDTYGHEGLNGAQVGGFQGADDVFAAFDDLLGGGLFEGLFGRRGPRRGANVEHDLVLDLEEAVFGVKKVIEITRRELCPHCQGTGCTPGTQPVRCTTCNGHGQVQRSTGFFTMRSTCPRCHGRGQMIDKPCPRCDGAGRATKRIPVEVTVPAGVPSGATLRLAGQGELGEHNSPRGELFCNIHVRQHEFFERHEDDLICSVPVGYAQAALGAEIEVPALGGKSTTLHLKPGTQGGEIFRLRGMGVPHLGSGGRGDQLVQIVVEVPRKLSPQMEELLRKLAELEEKNVSPQRKSFTEKLKRYFTAEEQKPKNG